MDTPSDGHLAVALSGGGHRATLFALGALLALVDRGLNRRVAQISSVSGGSIANAFVAQRCHFDQLRPGELDPVAADLVATIVTRGLLTQRSIVANARKIDSCLLCRRREVNEAGLCNYCWATLSESELDVAVKWTHGAMP